MPKKTRTAQPSLFHRPVPEMPDGYYSSGPNPNLRRFVEEHATPYDPATDDYDVPPFDQPITTTKATAIYNMHTYWSKKPHDAIRQYISHYTQPGDLVLDPFCGSGGTALAALMEGRAAIAIDLSPAATFITKNYCTPVDVDELQRAFEALQADGQAGDGLAVRDALRPMRRQGDHGLHCLLAGFPVSPLSGEDTSVRLHRGRRTDQGWQAQNDQCVPALLQTRATSEEIRSQSQKFGAVPVLVSYECQEGCKPKRGERRHNDPDSKKRDSLSSMIWGS